MSRGSRPSFRGMRGQVVLQVPELLDVGLPPDFIVLYRWVTPFGDACTKCLDLANNFWEAENGFYDMLVHHQHGPVWNFATGSLTHPNCRCFIDIRLLIVWDGTLVDYGELHRSFREISEMSREIRTNFEAVGREMSEIMAPYELYRVTTYPTIFGRLAAGRPTPYDVLRLTRGLGPLAATIAIGALPIIRGITGYYDEQYRFWEDVKRRERDELWRRGLIP